MTVPRVGRPRARQTEQVSAFTPFPADGFTARWDTWDGTHHEELTLRWENEAWTALGMVSREQIQYVLRLSPMWEIRQFLLFRDLDEPDLWLGTDGQGRWGEMNGAHRPELDGCTDLALRCTPFDHLVPARRNQLAVDGAAIIQVIEVDVETLGLTVGFRHYHRRSDTTFHVEHLGEITEFSVDTYGLPLDIEGAFRRR